MRLTSSIAGEELTRINQFVYQEDAKTSLLGHAMIRGFLTRATGLSSDKVRLSRSKFGKPEICGEHHVRIGKSWPSVLDFNVSHSGDYCVLVGFWGNESCPDLTVGVDVTKVIEKKTKYELERFLSLMSRREFLPAEWDIVTQVQDDRQKCVNFTRLWCLKESFIKSIGLGLSFRLHRIDFRPAEANKYNISADKLKKCFISDTKVLVDGQVADDWCFLETALDESHLVAIGYNFKSTNADIRILDSDGPFVEITVDSLVKDLTPLTELNEENWTKFTSKNTKLT